MADLRELVREVLAEELARLHRLPGAPVPVTEEKVRISTNAELAAFVKRLLVMAQDGRLRADIEAGRHVFRLADGTGGPAPLAAHQPLAPAPRHQAPVRFSRGLISERDVTSLAPGMTRIVVGKSARFTPLAKDELRRRKIAIERATS